MKQIIFILLASAGIALAGCGSDRKDDGNGDTSITDTSITDTTVTTDTTDTSAVKRDSIPGDTTSRR